MRIGALALIVLALVAPFAAAQSSPPRVLAGIDVLARDNFRQLEGARVGVITNHTGIDHRGVSTVELLVRSPLVTVTAIFSPEHGFRGKLDEKVADEVDEQTGLPIYSLYGATRKPTKAMLKGIDTLVFDIQDIGCRFYTYISTLGLAMEAAAEHDLRIWVCDRPNPIGGVAVDGPVLDAGQESFVGFHTLPVRHGMTVGEIARMLATERNLKVDLRVVPLEGWKRSMLFDATGRYWVNPSPNMRSLTQALLYPGIGLLETTNVSVGRGTDTPFELVGAPWINGRALANRLNAAEIPGVRFVPTRFRPNASVFADEACEGINIIITHRDVFDPLKTGLAIATSLRALYPKEWNVKRYRRLLSDDAVMAGLEKGLATESLIALWQDELAAFQERRHAVLIYP